MSITIDKDHKYKIEGSDVTPISVTTLIKKWFAVFDEDEIIYKLINSDNPEYKGCNKSQILKKWKNMRDNGIFLHSRIEKYLKQQGNEHEDEQNDCTVEFQYFINFINKHNDLKLVESEKMIYSKDKKVAGTIDCLMKDEHGNYILIDWKCSNNIRTWSPEKGFGPFAKLNDCNYEHYMLQLNIYRHILETNYDIKVRKLWLVNLHHSNSNYKRYSMPFYDISGIWDELVSVG